MDSESQFRQFGEDRSERADQYLREWLVERPEHAALFSPDNPHAPANIGRVLAYASKSPLCFSSIDFAVELLIEKKELKNANGSPARKQVAPLPPVVLDKAFFNLIAGWSQADVDYLYANNVPQSEIIRKYELAVATYPGLHRARRQDGTPVKVVGGSGLPDDPIEARKVYVAMSSREVRARWKKSPEFRARINSLMEAGLI